MSGVKQYDPTALLDLAMDVFHRQSFHGTSTAELVDELGVNRKSMYAEFGSKQPPERFRSKESIHAHRRPLKFGTPSWPVR